MPAIAELRDLEVVAVADIDSARLDLVDQRFRISHRFREVTELLALGYLDAVACAPPPIAGAGCHCHLMREARWIDPPTGLSTQECDLLIDRARSDRTRSSSAFTCDGIDSCVRRAPSS
jgi:hypothetical protein